MKATESDAGCRRHLRHHLERSRLVERTQVKEIPGLSFSPEEIRLEQNHEAGQLRYVLTDVRRERTGVHAVVSILHSNGTKPPSWLGHDQFNITRSEERGRLIRAVRKQMGTLAQSAWPEAAMASDLNGVCFWAAHHYERQRFRLEQVDPYEEPTPASFALYPYLIANSGTIMFAKGGSGKSYLAMVMGICIATGNDAWWDIEQQPVLYINLERSPRSIALRDHGARKALHVMGPSGISYLHARGRGLRSIAKSALGFAEQHDHRCTVIMDSVSRTQLGTLNADETANEFIDTMNSLGCTWLGIGHTARGADDHIYGATHFQYGADVEVKMLSERQESLLGINLTITKANDIALPKPSYFAFEFGESGLQKFRTANASEFPELAGSTASAIDRAFDFITEQPESKTNTQALARGLSVSEARANIILQNRRFVKLPREGRLQMYGLRAFD
jgi:hypothetical protein